jgi:anti-anti-sigma regulatory factor
LILPVAEARGWVIAGRAKVFGGLLKDTAVLRITGHATWDISGLIRNFEQPHFAEIMASPRLVFDLTGCTFVDSTVVGLLSHLAAAYIKSQDRRPLLVYASDKIMKIVEMINGTFLFDLKSRQESGFSCEEGALQEIRSTDEVNADNLKANILLAHETLKKMSDANAAEFSSVVDLLKKPRQT